MTLVVDLPPEVELRVQEAAQTQGVNISTFFYETVAPRLRPNLLPGMSEAELLVKVREDLPEAFWKRFLVLTAKRDAETLTPSEWRELGVLRRDHGGARRGTPFLLDRDFPPSRPSGTLSDGGTRPAFRLGRIDGDGLCHPEGCCRARGPSVRILRLPSDYSSSPYAVEHIQPRDLGGTDDLENLA